MYSNVLFNSYSNKTMNNRLVNMFMNFIAICMYCTYTLCIYAMIKPAYCLTIIIYDYIFNNLFSTLGFDFISTIFFFCYLLF